MADLRTPNKATHTLEDNILALYTPFAGQIGQQAGSTLAQLGQNRLMGQAMQGDPQAMQRLSYVNPQAAQGIQDRFAQQAEQQQAAARQQQTAAQATSKAYTDFVSKRVPTLASLPTYEQRAEYWDTQGVIADTAFPEQPRSEAYTPEMDAEIVGGLKRPSGSFKDTSALRKEYMGQTKDFKTVNSSYGRILASAEAAKGEAGGRGSPFAQMGLVFNIMKMYDPTSTVRESEFDNAASARDEITRAEQEGSAVPRIVKDLINRMVGGQVLTAVQVDDAVADAARQYESGLTAYDQTRTTYSGIAEMEGFSPAKTVPDMATFREESQKAIEKFNAAREVTTAAPAEPAQLPIPVPPTQPQLPPGVSMEDVEFTAQKNGVTVEQVLQRLGGQ